ncbi:ATP-binding protein [Pedobacter aquatilis]|uniref:AAA family ATPase n=1 Tax=Pedobacter aquatilis TaxID=351343 RepID=UPI00293179D4|nr:ATP-binding protein [Pedobacter aquatilis]
MEAGSIRELSKSLINTKLGTQDLKLIRNAVIYGANSAGKSNFFKGFYLLKQLIKYSFDENFFGNNLPSYPFLLNEGTVNQPTAFEVSFLINHLYYRYSLVYDKDRVIKESLFTISKRKEEILFLRHEDGFVIGKHLEIQTKGEVKFLQKLAKPRILFLSVLAKFNVNISLEIAAWFDRIRIYTDQHIEENLNLTAELFAITEYKPLIYEIIKASDLGFSTIEQELEQRIEKQKQNAGLLQALYDDEPDKYKIRTKHIQYTSNQASSKFLYFDLRENESAGAQKFVSILGPIVKALKDGSIVWIDEIDSRLHTHLVQLLTQIVNSQKYSLNNGQVIFSSHDTHLFKKLRRDQLILVNKNEFGESSISSIYSSNPEIRADSQIDKEYLNKQLGGVPMINSQILLDFDSAENE